MNKTEFIKAMATNSGMTQGDAENALNGLVRTVTNELKAGGSITIAGFGTFAISERAERTGRNPKTGEVIPIEARRVVTFHASQKLKSAVEQAGTGSATAAADKV